MKRSLCWQLAILVLLGTCLGCGDKAVVPTGPSETPKKPPSTLPMMGPPLPKSTGKQR